MNFVKIVIPLILCLAAILVLNLWSANRQHRKPLGLTITSSPVLVFSVFNTIIIALLVGNYRPSSSSEEVNLVSPFFLPLGKDGEDAEYNIMDDTDDDDEEEYHGSDGYDEDDDDNGSDTDRDDEDSWQDEEEYDTDLERRIESFIAKVNQEWREERLREIYFNHNQQ